MNNRQTKTHFELRKRAVIIIGNYGSGKSEVAVNLALHIKRQGENDISIADLDVVNPYFRSREAIAPLESEGINVVVPRGGHFYADLPIILPEIKGLFENQVGTAIFDVGGDDVGCRILSSMENSVKDHELLMVVNHLRPFTSTLEGAVSMMEKLETSSKLKITGFIGNSHLMEDTSLDIVLEGINFLRKLNDFTGIEIRFVTVPEDLMDEISLVVDDILLLGVKRILQPPWRPGDYTLRKKRQVQV
ncbi:MAG: cobalamin biosynthesis protein CbiA [Deltaproteobacteria bacterium]|nr:cobalamin biosynthesis protein CbiA [Deltaproteobacteria bacterium]